MFYGLRFTHLLLQLCLLLHDPGEVIQLLRRPLVPSHALHSGDRLVPGEKTNRFCIGVNIGLRFHAVKSPGFTMFEKAAVHWTVKSRLTALRTRNVNEQLNADVWNSQQGTGMQATICQTTLQILQGIDWELFVLTALTSCTREFCA